MIVEAETLFPSAEELIRRCECSLHEHLFFRRVQQEPHLKYIWLVLANGREGMSQKIPRLLAHLASRVDDDRIRGFLAMALYDELGSGDISRRHSVLYDAFFAALQPYRPADFTDEWLEPGRILNQRMDRLFTAADAWEALGASMALEVFGKHIDVFLHDVMRKQPVALDRNDAEWLPLHVDVETKHAEESRAIARIISSSSAVLSSLWRGADETYVALCKCFDGLYEVCFGATNTDTRHEQRSMLTTHA
jgi:hypothetical protein